MSKRARCENIPLLLFVRCDGYDSECFTTPYSAIFTDEVISILQDSDEGTRCNIVPGCTGEGDLDSTVWTPVEDVTKVENIGLVVTGSK